VKQKQYVRKILLSVWWDKDGVIYLNLLPPNKTINAEVYCRNLDCLSVALRENRPQLRMDGEVVFQHDNAPPHTAAITNEKIRCLGWRKLPHPLYSPDLAPSDYHLFRSLQHFLKDKRFSNERELELSLWEFFLSKPKSFYKRGIDDLIER
jgi:[histone H3]-lysine36 N-dimethyltransferase SETMAR